MASPWIAALVALTVWWASTGAILAAVSRADRSGSSAHVVLVFAALPLLAAGWLGLVHTKDDTGIAAAYLAFLAAIAVWGWFELAFLAGVVTGPNARPCPPAVPPWERFLRAWGTVAHSEMALVASLVAMAALIADAPNRFGLWTFSLLFAARISAKLNVYLGVPNINVEFLPLPVRHLASHFRIAPMNGFFPVGVTALTLALGCFLARVIEAPSGTGTAVGFALLATLTALALVEHWFMVLPLPDARLWRWMMAPRIEQDDRVLPFPATRLREDASGTR
jgi:putative photosynthetic complex assembly protein 2